MKRVAFCVLILLLAMGCKCKKTVKGESESWTRNTQRVNELSTLYPGFKVPLQQQLEKAQQVMSAAKEISEKEKAAEKMGEANKLLTSGVVGGLSGAERSIKNLKSKIVDASSAAVDESDRQAARVATEEARRVMGAVEAALKQEAADGSSAEAILRKAQKDLTFAERDLNKIIKTARDKKRKAEAERKAKEDKLKAEADQARSDKEAEQKAKQPWKCEYCGSMNDPKKFKCKSCGASR